MTPPYHGGLSPEAKSKPGHIQASKVLENCQFLARARDYTPLSQTSFSVLMCPKCV